MREKIGHQLLSNSKYNQQRQKGIHLRSSFPFFHKDLPLRGDLENRFQSIQHWPRWTEWGREKHFLLPSFLSAWKKRILGIYLLFLPSTWKANGYFVFFFWGIFTFLCWETFEHWSLIYFDQHFQNLMVLEISEFSNNWNFKRSNFLEEIVIFWKLQKKWKKITSIA